MLLSTITKTRRGFTRRTYTVSAGLKPNTDRSASKPNFANSCENTKKFSGGIRLFAFQLLTAESVLSPANAAVLAFPPRASTMASTESSMTLDSSQFVNVSSLHVLAIECDQGSPSNKGMDRKEIIGPRLAKTRKALNLSAAELCRRIGCRPNRWSQYENGERKITLAIAGKLKSEFSIPLDWVYCGDPSHLPNHVAEYLSRTAAA